MSPVAAASVGDPNLVRPKQAGFAFLSALYCFLGFLFRSWNSFGEGLKELLNDLLGGRLHKPLTDTRNWPAHLRVARIIDGGIPGGFCQGEDAFAFQEPARPLAFDFHAITLGRVRVLNLDVPLISAPERCDADLQHHIKSTHGIGLKFFATGQRPSERVRVHKLLPDNFARGGNGVRAFEFHGSSVMADTAFRASLAFASPVASPLLFPKRQEERLPYFAPFLSARGERQGLREHPERPCDIGHSRYEP